VTRSTTQRFAGLAACLVIGLAPASAQTIFSNAFLKGSYTIEERPVRANNFSETALALIDADGEGKITGSGYVRVNGRALVPTVITGSYVVNGDGSGLLQINHAATAGDAGSGAFTHNYRLSMARLDAHLVRVDPGIFNTASLRGLLPASPGFSFNNVRGDYTLCEAGVFGFGQVYNWIGKLNLDDRGVVRGGMVYQSFGIQHQIVSVNGTYTVNPNGTGTITFAHLEAGLLVTSRFFFVIAPGERMQIVRIDNGAQTNAAIDRQQ